MILISMNMELTRNNRCFKTIIVVLTFMIFPISLCAQSQSNIIKTGAESLSDYLPLLKGKKIAVVANQTSIIGKTHLVDSLLSLGVDVVKVFAPEHGFRGVADAGEKVNDEKDLKTGLPIFSLYGKSNRKPSVEKLKDIDVVLFDLQDVGVRFYTYISTMHYVMEACAEQNKELIVLDRPNPNGHFVDGPVLKKGCESFIGMHPVPIVHGMTIGEYAQMINGEGWLQDKLKCPLKVIKCKNYSHSDFYELPVPPSPNLPNMSAIYLYPSLCLFEGTNVSVGRGTTMPFQQFGAPYITSGYSFVPEPMFGAKSPKLEGEKCYGFELQFFGQEYLKNYGKLYLYWLVASYDQCPDKGDFFRADGFFKLLTGDPNIRKMIESGKTAEEISASFQDEALKFKNDVRSKYLLYGE
jgi:uncharacterized protein YbbC (DUF1343 family)